MKIGQEVKCIKQYVYGAGHPQGGRNALIVGATYKITDLSWSMSTFSIVDNFGNKLWFNENNEYFEMQKKNNNKQNLLKAISNKLNKYGVLR